MDYFKVNREKVFKVFEAHQIKGFLELSDVLDICHLLRIFPDFLGSSNIEQVFQSISIGGFSKITFAEFEDFLKKISEKFFKTSNRFPYPAQEFFYCIKTPALKSYGVRLKIHRKLKLKKVPTQKRLSSTPGCKPNLSRSRLTRSSQKSYFKPFDSAVIEYKEKTELHSSKGLRSRLKQSSSAVAVVQGKPSDQNPAKNKLKFCIYFKQLNEDIRVIKRLSFTIWKLQ